MLARASLNRRLALTAARLFLPDEIFDSNNHGCAAPCVAHVRHCRRRDTIGGGRRPLRRHIVGSRGNFCTGALIAPKVVLTAAHCVQPGAEYKIVEYGAGPPTLQSIKSVTIHPAFRMDAMLAHRATADVALLQLDAPAKAKTPSTPGMPNIPILVGSRFTIAGIGVA